MGKIIVSLDPQVNRELLVKFVPEEYKNRKVVDTIIYQLDPAKDEFNPGYNDSEKRLVDTINEMMSRSKTDLNNKFVVSARALNETDFIELNLDDLLSKHWSEIVRSGTFPGQDSSIKYPLIELFASTTYKSGVYTPTRLDKILAK